MNRLPLVGWLTDSTFVSHSITGVQHRMVDAAYMSATALATVVFALMVVIIGMRVALIFEQRRRERFIGVWHPMLLECLVDASSRVLPAVHGRDQFTLLLHWNHLYGFLRGEMRARLIKLGNELGLAIIAKEFLSKPTLRMRLIGILTLGNLQAAFSWKALQGFLESPDSVVSLCAMRALATIDVRLAMPILIPQIATRTDWSPVIVANILHQVGLETASLALAEAAATAPPEHAARLLRFVSLAHVAGTGSIVRRILRDAKDERVVSVCLQVMREPEDLDFVRDYLGHPQWFIRVQAATTLGRLGLPGDEKRLEGLLSDREWWVRYRAAKALTKLPFITTADLAVVATSHPDKFARDIMIQVIAETTIR